MKQYIGTKTIMAEPMTHADAERVLDREIVPGTLEEDGYLVEYKDGYRSWAPKSVFEKIYFPTDGMDFSQALDALKAFKIIRRKGWNGKGLIVFRQIPQTPPVEIIPNMTSLPMTAKHQILATAGHIDYTSQCIIYNTQTGRADSWVPSSSDLFADDWEVVIIIFPTPRKR